MNFEYELIGSIVLNKDIETAIIGGITPDDLSEEPAKMLRYIADFVRKYKEYPGFAAIEADCRVSLSMLEGSGEPVSYYVDKLRLSKSATTINNAMQAANSKLLEDPSSMDAYSILSEALGECRRLQEKGSGIVNVFSGEFLDGHLEEYDRRAELAARGEIDGFHTPWKELDEATWGFHPGELWTIVARMGVGKTWLLMLILKHLIERDTSMLIVSMEMSARQIAARLFALLANVASNDLRKGRLGNFVREGYEEKLRSITVPLWIVDSSHVRGTEDIGTALASTKAKGAIVDGAYLLDKDKNMAIWERVSYVQGTLKQMTHRFECFICGSSQLNRSVKKKHKGAGTDALAFADAIGYDSDYVHGLFQDHKMEDNQEMLHRQLKSREGRPISFITEWDLDRNKFAFLDYFEEEKDEGECEGAKKGEGPSQSEAEKAMGKDVDF